MFWLPWILVVSMGVPQSNVYHPKQIWTREDTIQFSQDSGVCESLNDVIGDKYYGIDGCPGLENF
jgi:hypothetical protein